MVLPDHTSLIKHQDTSVEFSKWVLYDGSMNTHLRFPFLIVTFVFIQILPHLVRGQIPTSVGPISAAQGGGGRSSVDLGESYLLNPAAIGHLRGAGVQMAYNFYSSPFSDQTSLSGSTSPASPLLFAPQKTWQISLNENSPDSMFASSIYYSRSEIEMDSLRGIPTLRTQDGQFTIGNFIFPQMSMGLNYHFRSSILNEKTYQQHNGGLGFLWAIYDSLGLGLSFLDIAPSSPSIPAEISLGTTSGVGLVYLHKDFLKLRLDVAQRSHRLSEFAFSEVSFGLENSMTPWVLSRLGVGYQAFKNGQTLKKWSFGLGFDGPRFGIHYGFQSLIASSKGSEHSVDLVLPF